MRESDGFINRESGSGLESLYTATTAQREREASVETSPEERPRRTGRDIFVSYVVLKDPFDQSPTFSIASGSALFATEGLAKRCGERGRKEKRTRVDPSNVFQLSDPSVPCFDF